MALTRNFVASTSLPNQIALNWNQPLGLNTSTNEIIVTRTITHYPVELFNPDFPNKATDVRPVEIFRGSSIPGIYYPNASTASDLVNDGNTSYGSAPQWVAQEIIPNIRGNISSVKLPLGKTGTPTGILYVKIYSDSAGEPGSLLLTSNAINVATLPVTAGTLPLYSVTFPTTITLNAGTSYWVLLDFDAVTFGSDTVEVGTDSTDSYIGMTKTSVDDGGTWSPDTAIDLTFDVIITAISVSGNVLTDLSASFPTSPPLNGRLLRDSASQVFRIVSNTATTVTLSGNPVAGKYIILPDFPSDIREQQSFEADVRTTVTNGSITNLVQVINGSLLVQTFIPDELANMVFKDGAGTKFLIKTNDATTITFYETTALASIGAGMAVLNSFFNSEPQPYIDTFRSDVEAAARVGTGLLDNQFYYYTAFDKPANTNVAQAEFSNVDSGTSTQSVAISTKDRHFGDLLYSLWPSLYRELDATGDLQDIMNVFGFQFNEIHSYIDTFTLQNDLQVYVNALVPLSEQFGLPTIGYSIGIDTLRRIAGDLITAWKLKGSKEGIALFIRIITTWDITNGTGDFSSAVIDFLPNINALRFFDPNLGSTNTRITQTDPFVAGGRFAKSLPGIIIPGFFTFREFVITIPNVALYIGSSTAYSTGNGTTTMTDSSANFGAVDSLVGNFLLPSQDEVNDIFQIVSNTATTITVRGTVNNRVPGGKYAVLSPLNSNRFIILNKLLPIYIPFGTKAGFQFT